ncbi:MAG TPA: hypothetical protein VFS09_06185 [Candidatus Eisenbacteria bacterium]|nr:hypothetical protein [Candidatus Eisenbacteria bacterium]
MRPQNSNHPRTTRMGLAALAGLAILAGLSLSFAGCSKDAPTGAKLLGDTRSTAAISNAKSVVSAMSNPSPPAGLVTVSNGGSSLQFWPYTGKTMDGTSVDPINLVFRGNADPLTIRAALMALDGDRSAFGMPPMPPFNSRWEDAYGDVQTTWADGEGWTGSVIQLALGGYGPVRVHIRLFRTATADGQVWTLGGAHFEVLIPGTERHESLSWELARQFVMVDLARTGLLVAEPGLTDPISETPTYRTIDYRIYNGLPPELRVLIGGPLEDQTSNVPIPSDGRAAIFTLGGEPMHGTGDSQTITLQYGQLVPKPVCSDGPYDYIYVEGPIQLQRTSIVDENGVYSYTGRASGRLTVTPVNPLTSPPTPIGESYTAMVSEFQQGQTGGPADMVTLRSAQILPQNGGAEMVHTDLKVNWNGPKSYRVLEQCLQPAP